MSVPLQPVRRLRAIRERLRRYPSAGGFSTQHLLLPNGLEEVGDHRRTHRPVAAVPGVTHVTPSVTPLAQARAPDLRALLRACASATYMQPTIFKPMLAFV